MEILYKGVDISKHNSINWNKVRKTEIDFVLIRAGFGVNTVDAKFIENIENAIKCGLDIGIYWFSYASNPIQAKEEAEFCLKTISPYRKYINYPIWFDWEGDSYNYVVKTYNIIPTKELVSNIAISFMETIKAAGYMTGNYSNKSYLNNFFNDTVKNNYDTWLAHVKDKPGNPLYVSDYKGKYTIHQYSWVGKPSGFLSNTDMDYCYKDYVGRKTIATEEEPKKPTTYQIPEGIEFATATSKNVITTYLYNAHKDKKLSNHFQVKEFASKSGNKFYSGKVKVHNKLIIILEALYKELNCSKIIVNSGYRTKEHDIAVGGNGTGQHVLGRAADIVCYDKNGNIIPAKKVCCTLEDMGGIYGIGYISANATHVDTRPKDKKWWGDETKPGQPNISKLGYNSFHTYFKM